MNEFKKHFFYGIITKKKKKTNGVTIQCCINQDFIALYSNGIFFVQSNESHEYTWTQMCSIHESNISKNGNNHEINIEVFNLSQV